MRILWENGNGKTCRRCTSNDKRKIRVEQEEVTQVIESCTGQAYLLRDESGWVQALVSTQA